LAKPVTVTGVVLSGGAAGDYTVSQPSGLTANISAKPVYGTFTAQSKVYDGNRSATVLTRDLVGVVSSDDVHLVGGTATFDTKIVGPSKTVTLTGASLYGIASDDYSLASVGTTTAAITAKSVSVSFQVQDKFWDGTTAATIKASPTPALVGVVGGDDVTLVADSASATFDTAFVGTGKLVTGSGFTKDGDDAGNYVFASPQGATTASILSWSAAGKGFYAPVGVANSIFTPAPGAAPTTKPSAVPWNTVKGGQTVPLKFNIFAGTVEKKSLSDIKGFQQQQLPSCGVDAANSDPVDLTTTGGTTLRYDTTGGQWVQNWATSKVSTMTCYRAWVTFADGSSLEAFFQLSK
jgi:hypothetical protein